jgi:hypothetical protein
MPAKNELDGQSESHRADAAGLALVLLIFTSPILMKMACWLLSHGKQLKDHQHAGFVRKNIAFVFMEKAVSLSAWN